MLSRVLFVSPTASMSGAENSLLGLMAGLDRQRFQPLLLLPERGPFRDRADGLGIETVVMPLLLRFDQRHRLWRVPRVALSVLTLVRLLRARRIAVVHSNKLGVSFSVGLAARLARVPAVLHVRDSGLEGLIPPWKGRLIAALADRIIAVSGAAARSIGSAHPLVARKTMVSYTGVDLAAIEAVGPAPIRSELRLPPTAFLVGAVGRIEPGKGYHVLVDAAAALVPACPDLHVLVIGAPFASTDNAYAQALRHGIRDRRLERHVILLGHRDDALAVVKALDVLVHPALCPDSLPRAVLEAAALGTAVVASRVGGIPEILADGDSGLLVAPGDAEALAAALGSLRRDPAARIRLAAAAREVVARRFTVARHVAEIEAVYRLLGAECRRKDTADECDNRVPGR